MSVDRTNAAEAVELEFREREQQFRILLSPRDANTPAEWDAVRETAKERGWEPEAGADKDELEDSAAEFLTDWAQESLDEEILGVSASVLVMVRVELSAGGPGDWLEATYSPSDRKIREVTYHYAWSGHASMDVPESSPLWMLAERYVDYYTESSLDELAKDR